MKPVIYITFNKNGSFERFDGEPWCIGETHTFVTEFEIGIHLVSVWVKK